MAFKDIWAETSNWLRSHRINFSGHHRPEIDEEGLISQDSDSIRAAETTLEDSEKHTTEGPRVEALRRKKPDDKNSVSDADTESAVQYPVSRVENAESGKANEPLEKFREGFDKLVNQLEGINGHLNRQAEQHEALMERIKQLPGLLESFPAMVENQKKITEQLLEQLRSMAAKNEQFMDAVEKIPAETSKQTDALVEIDHQLAAAADIDVQMADNFNSFNRTLDKLNQSTTNQTDGILQMSKTFAASDRYLKYILSKQNRRFMWVFFTAISICTVAILILTGIIIYLRSV
jgi:archaellum component FlaC